MPEIAEVARIVHFLRLHLVGKTIKSAKAIEDTSVFGKVGTTGPEVAAALAGKKVLSAGNQGKYFWIVLDRPPHLVCHFGMTGWIHIKGDRTAYTNYYKKMKPEELDAWPPKHWKFHLKTENPPVEVAFTDPRRFGRVRLVDCPGEEIRNHSPLVENGPDPVVDIDVFTGEFLRQKMRSRHVPIKALLLDQKVISGIGNWVADEVLFHSKLHPEQYCDDFSDGEIEKLYNSIRYVCQFAVDKLGDSDQFPENWLFQHRWSKGVKGAVGHLPTGEKLAFLTVGGRTSCYVPKLQQKSGRIVSGVKEELIESGEEPESDEEKPKVKKAAAAKTVKTEGGKSQNNKKRKAEEDDHPAKRVKVEDNKPQNKKRKAEEDERPAKKQLAERAKKTAGVEDATSETKLAPGTRRSGRLQGKSA